MAECWPDSKILNELGKRLGHAQYFWNDMRGCLDEILKPSGMTYDDFKAIGILKGKWEYRTFEKKGFNTPSGKVEIYSEQLKDWGYDPLPHYKESPLDHPELTKEYPLIFTSAKDPFYFHSAYRNIPSLRRLSPEPIVLIHPDTAARFGVSDGDWVAIETKQGTIRQKAKLEREIDPRIIVLSFGWWYPERRDLELSGWKESNLNILTSNDPPYEPAIGSTFLRAAPCRISKSQGF
jgi:anaerobic selenocysteine-containing dehydrogenase